MSVCVCGYVCVKGGTCIDWEDVALCVWCFASALCECGVRAAGKARSGATLGVPSRGSIDVHPLGSMLELLRVGAESPQVDQRGVRHELQIAINLFFIA